MAKLGAAVIGTYFLQGVSAFLMSFVPLPEATQNLTLTMATGCFFLAMLVLVFGHSVRAMKWPIIVGFGFIIITLLAGVVLATSILIAGNPNLTVLLFGDLVAVLVIILFIDTEWLRSLGFIDRSQYITAFEIHSTPTDKEATTPVRVKFKRTLTNLAALNIPLGFRFQHFPDGHTRLFLFTWAPTETLLAQRQKRLHQILSVHLTGVTMEPQPLPSLHFLSELPASIVFLSGSPSDDAEGFNALQTAIQTHTIKDSKVSTSSIKGPAILYQVSTEPYRFGRFDYWLIRRRLRPQIQDVLQLLAAEEQIAQGIPPSPELALKLGEPKTVTQAHQILRKARQLHAQHLLNTRVVLVSWHPTSQDEANKISQTIAKRVTSTLQPITPTQAVTYRTPFLFKGKRQIRRILHGSPMGPTSPLLPEETATYFGIM